MTSLPNIGAEAQGVAARMRDGVKALSLVGGLSEAVARLSTCSARDLRTRSGVEAALAEIRHRFPAPDDTLLYLSITTATPPEAVKVFDQMRAVLERDPTVGILHERRPTRAPKLLSWPEYEVSGVESVPMQARKAWSVFTSIAVACRIEPRDVKSARALALAGARALRQLEGRQRKAVSIIAAVPRAQALNPDAAAIAFAHAPRESGGVAVVVVKATEASVWRSSGKTGIRPVAAQSWHRDPVVAAAMAASAKASIARCAPCQVTATHDQTWTQVLLAQTEGGFEAYVQRPDGRVDHVEVLGRGSWASLGAEEAARLAAACGRPVDQHSWHWLSREAEGDADQDVTQPSLAALAAAGRVTSAEMERFRFRLDGAERRTRDAAVLAFLACLPPATARLARVIRPIRSWDPKSNRRYALSRQDLDAAVAAATHADPGAMVRAVENPSTRALLLAAALCGPWKVASEAIASGHPPWKALLAFASAAIDRPLSRAAAKSLAGWPSSPGHGLLDTKASLADFCDHAMLAAVLWDGTPSRPAMTTVQLVDLKNGLSRFGFVPPSVAGPGYRTWDDPVITTAYADALRRKRHDTAGSAGLGSGVLDMIRFLDGKLTKFRFAGHVREAVRRAILVPPGRLVPGLERLSDQMHRSIASMDRERHALTEELISEEMRENGGSSHQGAPEDFPNPLAREIVHEQVVIRPLRQPREIEQESIEMASCVSTYRDKARIGDLLLYSLRSTAGRSTLGLEVQHHVRGIEICIFQHYGAQHTRVDAPPPPEHRDVASWLLSSLERPDGALVDRKWREALSASRRAHLRSASLRLSEQDLSPARRRRLAELDLVHLGCLLGKREYRFDLEHFHQWSEHLASDFASGLDVTRQSG